MLAISSVIQHCPACGKASFIQNSDKSFRCSACEFTLFLNPSAAAAVIIECDRHLLFAVRGNDPGLGKLDLPGGFVDPYETAEAALARELNEELGLTHVNATYFASFPNEYPYKGVTYRTIDMIYTIQFSDRPTLTAADDVASVRWVARDAIDPSAIAFTSIRQAVTAYLAAPSP